VDWNDLRYLLAVHRRGSLAAAAKDLGVTKATAGRRLAALEEALGVKLVERKPAGLALTAAGREAIVAAEGIDAAVVALRDRVSAAAEDQPRGLVRVTAPPWLAARCFIPALPELKAAHPGLEVELAGSNLMLNLAQREADIGIRNARPTQKSLTARKIGVLGGCVYASQLYLDRRGTPASRAALAGHDVLAYETMSGMPGFEWLREPGRGARVAFRANDPTALVGAATAGLGLAAVPCLLGDPEPALRRVETLGFNRCDLFLVMPESLRTSVRVRVVADFLLAALKTHRAAIEG
jgi:molybdate transport repressor ModE-like protein